jgi:hypothetical protein
LHPSETIREWISRVFERPAEEVVRAYEEVRYGEAPDSAERASWVAKHWPSRGKLPGAGPNNPKRRGGWPDQ